MEAETAMALSGQWRTTGLDALLETYETTNIHILFNNLQVFKEKIDNKGVKN